MDRIFAPAKINLFLEVCGRRADGFHTVDTVMQTVTLCDTVYIEINDGGRISVSCPALDLPEEKNLAYKAAALYFEKAGIKNRGADVRIEKRIPAGAGLGGGSSDAAAVLRGLNARLSAFSPEELRSVAALVGSDVPFCVNGGCARAGGRGEELSGLPRGLPDCFILIAKRAASTSTAEAYAALDRLDYSPRENVMPELLAEGDLNKICSAAFNRFENAAPFDVESRDIMLRRGALTAHMTGSGSAVFGVFESEGAASAAKTDAEKSGAAAFVCRPAGEVR